MFFLLLTELGLCDDKKTLKNKRTKRTLKEGEPGYLKSASESDSALDDSTEEYDTVESDSDDSDTLQNHQENIRSKGLDVSQDDVAKPGLLWLKSCLEDELEDLDLLEPDDLELGKLRLGSKHWDWLKVHQHLGVKQVWDFQVPNYLEVPVWDFQLIRDFSEGFLDWGTGLPIHSLLGLLGDLHWEFQLCCFGSPIGSHHQTSHSEI